MKYGIAITASALAILSLGLICANAYADETPNTQPSANTSMEIQPIEIRNKLAGEAFLKKNKTAKGVKTLADGLQYKVITEGKGPSPTDNDSVTVDYKGTLVDGSEFDSSYKRHQPATFPVNGVIPGWTEALKLMKVGSTWELYIPASLAYGENGQPPSIGPNETLIFEVKLISINKS